MKFLKSDPVVIFLLAFTARLIFVLIDNSAPLGDAGVYDNLALSISHGQGYVNADGSLHTIYPPFYPFFLSVIYMIFGHSYKMVGVIQSIIGAFSCALIYLIGKKVYGRISGITAALIGAMYFPFIKSAGMLLTESFFTFLLISIIFYLLKVRNENSFPACIIFGLLLGMAMLTKSIMLFFPIFIMPTFFYLGGKYSINAGLKKYALILLVLSFSLMPWAIRNYNVYHKFAPTSVEGGFGFYSSYCPANGIFGLNAASDDPVVIEGFKIASPVLRSKYFVKKTWDFIVNNPKKIIMSEAKKIIYFWAPFDWEIVGNRWFNLAYVLALPFFAIGFFLAIKEFRKNYPILAPIIYFQIMTLAFYGSPRFRLPIEPYIFILAAVGFTRSLDWIQNKRE